MAWNCRCAWGQAFPYGKQRRYHHHHHERLNVSVGKTILCWSLLYNQLPSQSSWSPLQTVELLPKAKSAIPLKRSSFYGEPNVSHPENEPKQHLGEPKNLPFPEKKIPGCNPSELFCFCWEEVYVWVVFFVLKFQRLETRETGVFWKWRCLKIEFANPSTCNDQFVVGCSFHYFHRVLSQKRKGKKMVIYIELVLQIRYTHFDFISIPVVSCSPFPFNYQITHSQMLHGAGMITYIWPLKIMVSI